MTRYVALFRGINVGRAKRIAMADLRALLETLGYRDVRTLLNSGNAVFDATGKSPAWHAARIREAVATSLNVDALVIVQTAQAVAAVLAEHPLRAVASDPSRLLIAFTCEPADLRALDALASIEQGNEAFVVGAHAAYLWCADGILESKLATRLLKLLEKTGTTRNLATVEKLHALLQIGSTTHA